MGGLHPVVAVYATFLNRAFDQVLMDVALHRCGVTFCLDRSGVTGPDGASHHGMWDMAFLQVVPGLRLAAPRDAVTLREELREAVAVDDAPTVVRYPTGAVGPTCRRSSGSTASTSCAGTATTCCWSRSARWSAPASTSPSAAPSRGSASRSSTRGGSSRCPSRSCGWLPAYGPWSSSRTACAVASPARWRRPCATPGCPTPLRDFGVPLRFLDHAKRPEVLAEIGLTAQDIARDIVETVSEIDGRLEQHPVSD